MALEKFSDDLSGEPPSPPYRISAGKLDRNYARCYPKDWDGDDKPYIVKPEDDGWLLEFERTLFDVCENGSPVQYNIFATRST